MAKNAGDLFDSKIRRSSSNENSTHCRLTEVPRVVHQSNGAEGRFEERLRRKLSQASKASVSPEPSDGKMKKMPAEIFTKHNPSFLGLGNLSGVGVDSFSPNSLGVMGKSMSMRLPSSSHKESTSTARNLLSKSVTIGSSRKESILVDDYENRVRRKVEREFSEQSMSSPRIALGKSMSVSRLPSKTAEIPKSSSRTALNKSITVASPPKVFTSLEDFEGKVKRKIERDFSEKKIFTAFAPVQEAPPRWRVAKTRSRRDLLDEKLERKKRDDQNTLSKPSDDFTSKSYAVSAVSLDEKIRRKKMMKSKSKKTSRARTSTDDCETSTFNNSAKSLRSAESCEAKPCTKKQGSFGKSSTSMGTADNSETSWDDLAEVIDMVATESLSESLRHDGSSHPFLMPSEHEHHDTKLTFQDVYAYSKTKNSGKDMTLDSSFTIRDLAPRNSFDEEVSGGEVDAWSELEDVLKKTAAESMSALPEFTM
mmetsp:Transcript_14239/g.29916  ORF Transcript_14239/g.29916 Transcript_14239/m.29916 type:complete len:480 (-) Transcript_14239:177-1616(-)|eukprot:CAMPEP_0171343212 /NCGR_PEP_ID=MMETSP0878-20121228/16504_1 /TAXON_ID=67004 /ORGANISM="Thalassiosira weissflogii, Strain CCMP1336" /LENGTH=479 /DNA_ID=CAMNT_0011846099 /DNA_START=37 /DNA_END=1476 /DNA_ORIENTATION=-